MLPSNGGSSGSGSGSALSGLGGTLEQKDCDLLCPVCFELISEAYVTRCGHSFCYQCITKSLELHRRCPKCGASLPTREHIFPNFLLNELVAKRRQSPRPAAPADAHPDSERLRELVASESRHLAITDVDVMLDVLQRRKRMLEAESALSHHKLVYEFLSELLRGRQHQLDQLHREVALVQKDIDHVVGVIKELQGSDIDPTESPESILPPTPAPPSASETPHPPVSSATGESETETFAGGPPDTQTTTKTLNTHFDDFVQCYFSHRGSEMYVAGEDDTAGLDAFREDLVAFTRYKSLRPLATLSYSSDAINYSTIVSTIEFDKDEEYFAIAGVTKRIKVFEFGAVVGEAVDVHYPCAEMSTSHKISCLCWNHYHKNIIASSDYEGTVSVWDAATATRTRALQEHDKRCWSVDFNRCDVRLLASGSDDARVKLWALNAERSVATLDAKFNVCCVRFNPRSSCHLAFGSADHCVHYFDLRCARAPLAVFREHRKAVSYVQFLDGQRLVSASTDSQLKLWAVDSPRCVRSFTGHLNEKNFVGLATDGKYIACGSETNALFVYYSGMSRPLLSHRFSLVRGFLERGGGSGTSAGAAAGAAGAAGGSAGGERRDEDPPEFVSAVCWRRRHRPALLAANSQGTIKVLELV